MKTTRSLIILLIGIILIVSGLFMGADFQYSFPKLGSFPFISGGGEVVGEIHPTSSSSGRQQVEFDAKEHLEFYVSLGELKIYPSKDDKVHLDYETKGLGWSQSLYVDEQEKGLTLSLKASKNPFIYKSITTRLYLPQSIKHFKITADMGEVDLENLHQMEIDLQANMGSVELKNTHLSGRISLDMGSLELENTTLEKATVTLDMGSLQGSSSFLGTNTLTAQMGSVELELLQNPKEVYLDLHAELGSVKAVQGGSASEAKAELHANVELGSIVIKTKDKD